MTTPIVPAPRKRSLVELVTSIPTLVSDLVTREIIDVVSMGR